VFYVSFFQGIHRCGNKAPAASPVWCALPLLTRGGEFDLGFVSVARSHGVLFETGLFFFFPCFAL